MANENVCATIKCPPLRESGSEFVGKTIREVRSMLKDKLEIADGSAVSVSTDDGETYKNVDSENHVIQDKEIVEFGRGSSSKGFH